MLSNIPRRLSLMYRISEAAITLFAGKIVELFEEAEKALVDEIIYPRSVVIRSAT